MPPPDELRTEYEDLMRLGRSEGGGNIAPAVLAQVGDRNQNRLFREYRIDELTANVMSMFLTRPVYHANLLHNVNRDLTINDVPEDQQRQVYDYILRIVREANTQLNRGNVVNRLKLQRMMSGKHGDVESTIGSFLTTGKEPFEVQKSRALALVGRPGVRDFSPGAPPPPPPPPGGAGPAAAGGPGGPPPAGGAVPTATNVGCTGGRCSVMGGRRRKTTRSPSRSSRRRRSTRSRRNRGNARSL